MDTLEQRALALASDETRLRDRLLEARRVLRSEVRKKFWPLHFDRPNRRLLSADETLALEWRLRLRPDEPESPDNQQTSVGVVVLVDAHKPA